MNDTTRTPGPTRTALLAGATGLVGRELLGQLLQDPLYSEVHVLSRRPLDAAVMMERKLHVLVGPLADLPVVPRVSDVFIALGTTIKQAGSERAFSEIDHDLVLHIAQLAREAGALRLAVVSSLGANPRSTVFYSRVKGEMESALQMLGYPSLIIVRPSFLAGDRASLKQPHRSGEDRWLKLLTPVARWLPASVRPVAAAAVARVMRERLLADTPGTLVVESRLLQEPARAGA